MIPNSPSNADSQWYKSFFSGLAADFWCGVTDGDWTQDEITLLQKIFGTPQQSPRILDVLCGAGRHMAGLYTAGYQPVGMDLSETMLAKASEEGLPDSVSLFHGDALAIADVLQDETSTQGLFDGTYCLGNSLGYFDAAGMTLFFEGLSAVIKPGGTLVLHSNMVAETLLPNWEEQMQVIANGVFAVAEHQGYDTAESALTTRFVFEKENEETGRVEKTKHLIRHYIYTTGEITRGLRKSGFEPVTAYGTRLGKGYALGDEQWYGVFRKTAD